MATSINSIARPTAADLKRDIQGVANEMHSRYYRWLILADWLNKIQGSTAHDDMIAMGFTEAEYTELAPLMAEFRTTLNEVCNFLDGTGTSRTSVPITVMDNLRRPIDI